MSFNQIPAGKNPPEDIYVIIEIPAFSTPVKYEIDKKNGTLFVDRFIPTAMFYPCNYGYINHTLSIDGDPIDALVYAPHPIQSGAVVRCRPIGLLKMIDELGEDTKIVSVPHTKLSKKYDYIKDAEDLPNILKTQIFHFFQHYKDLELEKWVKIDKWENAEAAKDEIMSSIQRANKNSHTSKT